jgi:hypothetical protein
VVETWLSLAGAWSNVWPKLGRNIARTLTVTFAETPPEQGQQDVNDD